MKSYLLVFMTLFFTSGYSNAGNLVDLPIASVANIQQYVAGPGDKASMEIRMQNPLPPPRSDLIGIVLNGELISNTRQVAEKTMVVSFPRNLLRPANNQVIAVWYSQWISASDATKRNQKAYAFNLPAH